MGEKAEQIIVSNSERRQSRSSSAVEREKADLIGLEMMRPRIVDCRRCVLFTCRVVTLSRSFHPSLNLATFGRDDRVLHGSA